MKTMSKSSKSVKSSLPSKPEPFSDSFTTTDACFSVEVKPPWGECVEDVEIKIDCNGMVHGDEDLIDLLIEMLENAKENLVARRGKLTRSSQPSVRIESTAPCDHKYTAGFCRFCGDPDGERA